jgi:lipopolysaccharide export system protein LptC
MGLRGATFLFLILATGCRPARLAEARQIIPELTMDGVQFRVDRGGLTTASGEAERLTYRRDTTDVAAVKLSMDLVTATGLVRVTAPNGAGNLGNRQFRATGGLRATRGSDVAETGSATSSPGPDGRIAIHGVEPVQVEGPGYRLNGTGFDIDPVTGDIAIRGKPHLVTGLGARP